MRQVATTWRELVWLELARMIGTDPEYLEPVVERLGFQLGQELPPASWIATGAAVVAGPGAGEGPVEA